MPGFDKNIPFNNLPPLPPKIQLETREVLKICIEANRLLAELKGYCQTLPNPHLLLNTIVLQESKESSAIENIVTTQDELYRAALQTQFDQIKNVAAKEVIQYRQAMYWGMEQLTQTGLITTNMLVGIMQKLRATNQSIRTNSGTKLSNPETGDVVYTPPEGEALIREKLGLLEQFINLGEYAELDPLIKMALIHYQFEAIHPFTDGNGRTGRILNVLFLVQQKLLSLPVLYLSQYIIRHKGKYYRLLREVTEHQNWVEWVLFIVTGVGETARITLEKIAQIQAQKEEAEKQLRKVLEASYTRELLDVLFSFPYVKISVLEERKIAKRQTAAVYLRKLEATGFLQSVKIGKEVYYINHALMELLSRSD